MRCPVCNGDIKVVDTGSNGDIVIRRRKCTKCKHTFYTSENIILNELGAPLLTKFRNGTRKK